MTIDEAEQLLVERVQQYASEGLHVHFAGTARPSFRIVGTRVGTEKEGVRYVIVMKRVSQDSPQMRDDFDQLATRPEVLQDPKIRGAIREFRQELRRIIPKADPKLVGKASNQDLPKGSIAHELKTAIHFDVVAAAKHVDEVVGAMVQLAQALR